MLSICLNVLGVLWPSRNFRLSQQALILLKLWGHGVTMYLHYNTSGDIFFYTEIIFRWPFFPMIAKSNGNKWEKLTFENRREVRRKTLNGLDEWINYTDIFCLCYVVENSRQYVLLQTDILKKTVTGCPWRDMSERKNITSLEKDKKKISVGITYQKCPGLPSQQCIGRREYNR